MQIRVDNFARPDELPVEESSAFNGEPPEPPEQCSTLERWLFSIAYGVLVLWVVALHIWAVRELLAGRQTGGTLPFIGTPSH